jgi:hypothetical protein
VEDILHVQSLSSFVICEGRSELAFWRTKQRPGMAVLERMKTRIKTAVTKRNMTMVRIARSQVLEIPHPALRATVSRWEKGLPLRIR